MVHTATLLSALDVQAMMSTETGILVFKDGKLARELPEAIKTNNLLGQLTAQVQAQRQLMGPPRAAAVANAAALAALAAAGGSLSTVGVAPNGTPVSAMQRMQPPTLLQMRMQQSNGMLRPVMPPPQGSPTRQLSTGAPGISPTKSPLTSSTTTDGIPQPDGEVMAVDQPLRPKSVAGVTGYPPNGFPTPFGANAGATYIPHNAGTNGGAAVHQLQDIKSAFAGATELAGRPGFPTHVVTSGTNFNLPLGTTPFDLKMPTKRQPHRPQPGQPLMPGVDGSPLQAQAQLQAVFVAAAGAANGSTVSIPSPMRTPSAGRIRPDAAQLLAPASPLPLPLVRSPHLAAASPVPGVAILSPRQSPMRVAPPPVPPSPSL
jgi:hypothetical protein